MDDEEGRKKDRVAARLKDYLEISFVNDLIIPLKDRFGLCNETKT